MSKSLKKNLKDLYHQKEFNANNNNINMHENNNLLRRQIASMPQNKFKNDNYFSPVDFLKENEQFKLPKINQNNNVNMTPNIYISHQNIKSNVPIRIYSNQMQEDYIDKKIAKSNPFNNRVYNAHKEIFNNQMQEGQIMNFNENRNIIGNKARKNKKKNQGSNIERNFPSVKIIKKKETIDKKEIKNNNSAPKMYLKVSENEYIKIIEEQKIKINILEEKINQFTRKEEELNKRSFEFGEREKMYIKKINILEDNENKMRKQFKEYENLKGEIALLDKENKELKKQIKEKEEVNINIEKIIKNNNKKNEMAEENKKLTQDISMLKGRIKELEEEIDKLKNGKNGKKVKKIKLKSIDYVISHKVPTLIGLNNIGATCFMNSTLQCLSQTKELTNYFLNKNNKNRIINNNIALKNKDALQLSPVYLDLIQNLWDENGPKSFSPNKFMNTVDKMNPLFKTGQAGDAKDFIIFILEQIHKELKMPISDNNNINDQKLNQYDRNNAFYYFFNEFRRECSVISDIFFGFTETTNECLNCKYIYNSKGLNNPICYNYGIFNCLIFPLEEVKNMKNNSVQNKGIQNNNNIVSIYDCFYYNQKSDLFTGDNRNYCNICKQLFDSIYTSKIFISSNVLVLILNRGRGNIYNVKLDFFEVINITQFVQQKDCPQLMYNLYGVITHIGESGPNAHFVASCKSPIDNKWYRYNDAFVNPITDLQKEVINFGTPYILFYQKNIVKNN